MFSLLYQGRGGRTSFKNHVKDYFPFLGTVITLIIRTKLNNFNSGVGIPRFFLERRGVRIIGGFVRNLDQQYFKQTHYIHR